MPMKDSVSVMVAVLDGSCFSRWDRLTRFGQRKGVPIYFDNCNEVVGSADFRRRDDGGVLMAHIKWLGFSQSYQRLSDTWQRGEQLFLNTYFDFEYADVPGGRQKIVNILKAELQTLPAAPPGFTPGVFSWP